MSVYNKNAGHGVTGSFNTYVHPKTKIGNFVEDTIGRDLVDYPRQTPTMYETCAKSSYTEPSMRKSHMGPNEAKFSSSVKLMTKGMKSSTILKFRPMFGLSFHLFIACLVIVLCL